MSILRIGYFADGPWSHQAFEKLIADHEISICFIVPRKDTSDFTLQRLASEHGIPYLPSVEVNSEKFLRQAGNFNCDLFVSMSFNQIFREKVINLPKYGTINCHAGKLPFYRGRNILNWALINDESDYGITVHFVDGGIDTGNILLQKTYEINDEENYKSLLRKSFTRCAEVLYSSVVLFKNGQQSGYSQKEIDPIGTYCSRRIEGDETINWDQTSRQLFNFIRAICHPAPKATTWLLRTGSIVKINAAREIPHAKLYINPPGAIVGKTKEGLIVKTNDTTLELREIECDSAIRIGDRFVNGPIL